jgi:hypothetical protein
METSLIPRDPATTGGLFVPKTSIRVAALATFQEISDGAVIKVQAGCWDPVPLPVVAGLCPGLNEVRDFEVGVLAKSRLLMGVESKFWRV